MEKEARQVLAKELADTLNAEFAKWTNLYGDKRAEKAIVSAIYGTVGIVTVTADYGAGMDYGIGMLAEIVDVWRSFKAKHPEMNNCINVSVENGRPAIVIFT